MRITPLAESVECSQLDSQKTVAADLLGAEPLNWISVPTVEQHKFDSESHCTSELPNRKSPYIESAKALHGVHHRCQKGGDGEEKNSIPFGFLILFEGDE